MISLWLFKSLLISGIFRPLIAEGPDFGCPRDLQRRQPWNTPARGHRIPRLARWADVTVARTERGEKTPWGELWAELRHVQIRDSQRSLRAEGVCGRLRILGVSIGGYSPHEVPPHTSINGSEIRRIIKMLISNHRGWKAHFQPCAFLTVQQKTSWHYNNKPQYSLSTVVAAYTCRLYFANLLFSRSLWP
jgi:hypothetical protein